jgi:hypothetical protein
MLESREGRVGHCGVGTHMILVMHTEKYKSTFIEQELL